MAWGFAEGNPFSESSVEQYGWSAVKLGDADVLARAKGTAVQS
jgi:hypothetical protein